MAIKLTNATVEEVLTYDRVFMRRLSISQKRIPNVDTQPVYSLELEYQLYAIGANGDTHYQQRIRTVTISDYLSEATAKAVTGDMDLMNALLSIQTAIASILLEKDNIPTQVIP